MGDHAARLREENVEVIRRADLLQVLLEAAHIDVEEQRPEELPIQHDGTGDRRRHHRLAFGRLEGVGIGQHHLVRLLHFRVPGCSFVAVERDHLVAHRIRDEATGCIRVGRIRHFRVLAVERPRRKARARAQEIGIGSHRIAQHLHDGLAASRLRRRRLQDLLHPQLRKRRCFIRPCIARLNLRRNLPQLIVLFRLRAILQGTVGHIADDPQDDRHHHDDAAHHDAVDLESDPPSHSALLRPHFFRHDIYPSF